MVPFLFAMLVIGPTYLSWGKGIDVTLFHLAIHQHTAAPSIAIFLLVLLTIGFWNKKWRDDFLADLAAYDRCSPSVTRRVEIMVWLVITGFLMYLKEQQASQLLAHGYDTGIFVNVLWNLAHGNGYWSSFRHMNFLGDHFSPGLIFLSIPYHWALSVAWPLMAQTLAMMTGVGILLFIARNIHPIRPSERVLVLFFVVLNMYFQKVHAFDLHAVGFALPMVIGLYCLARLQKWGWLYPLLPLAYFTIQEDVSLMVMGLGLICFFSGERKHGALLIGLSAIAFYLNVAVCLYHFAGPTSYMGRYQTMGGSLGGIAMTLLLKPWVVLKLFLNPGHFYFLFRVFLSFGLLPLLCGVPLLGFLPSIAQNSLSDYSGQFHYGFHYSGNLLPYLMVGTVVWLSFHRKEYPALLVGFLALSAFSCFRGTPYIRWVDPAYKTAVHQLADSVNSEVPVCAQDSVAVPFSFRKNIYDFPEIGDAQLIVLAPSQDPWPLSIDELNDAIKKLEKDPTWKEENDQNQLLLFRKVT